MVTERYNIWQRQRAEKDKEKGVKFPKAASLIEEAVERAEKDIIDPGMAHVSYIDFQRNNCDIIFKFARNYPKLDDLVFSTIRMDNKDVKPGYWVEIRTNNQSFYAKCIHLDIARFRDLPLKVILRDTDTQSYIHAVHLMESFYDGFKDTDEVFVMWFAKPIYWFGNQIYDAPAEAAEICSKLAEDCISTPDTGLCFKHGRGPY